MHLYVHVLSILTYGDSGQLHAGKKSSIVVLFKLISSTPNFMTHERLGLILIDTIGKVGIA